MNRIRESCPISLRKGVPPATLAIALWFILSHAAWGQFRETFESDQPTWQLRQTDCDLPQSSWFQQRTASESHTGRSSEHIRFHCGPGTKVLVAHPVPPAAVIRELNPSVWVKASRPSVQLMVRIVLPHTPDPNGEGPMTTLVAGPFYDRPDEWMQLCFSEGTTDIRSLLDHQVRLLRKAYGGHVDARDAYVDLVVLNVYGGRGTHDVWIDDLEVAGLIRPAHLAAVSDSEVMLASHSLGATTGQSRVRRDGTVIEVNRQAFFARIIQSNGESFDALRALGFNVIELEAAPTERQLADAERLDLWLLSPPPSTAGLHPIDTRYDRVLAWVVGNHLTGRDAPHVSEAVREIRHSDVRQGRPIVGFVASGAGQFAHLLDVVGLGREPVGTTFPLNRYGRWLAEQHSPAAGLPMWADIQTELAPVIARQIAALDQRSPPLLVEPQQAKILAWQCLGSGARGVRFLSRSRLDLSDPASRLRAQTLYWLNLQLMQLEPWAAGGVVAGRLETRDPTLDVAVLRTSRARLLLVSRLTGHEQWVAGDVETAPVAFDDPSATTIDRAYQITEAGLLPLPDARHATGLTIRLNQCPYTAAVLLTGDSLVVNRLSQQSSGGQNPVQMRSDLTRQWLVITQLIDEQLRAAGRGTPAVQAAWSEAAGLLRQADSLIAGGSASAALLPLDRADQRLAWIRAQILRPTDPLMSSSAASPLLAHTALMPIHWAMANRIAQANWRPNALPGGDFENLEHMVSHGWENRRSSDPSIGTRVELSADAARSGQYGLIMAAWHESGSPRTSQLDPAAAGSAGLPTTVWISTAPVAVRAGQVVRVHGWINLPRPMSNSHEGLTIVDSLGGPPLAHRIRQTEGWQEFVMYRGVPEDGRLQVTFALTGTGTAWIDDITVRLADLPPSPTLNRSAEAGATESAPR